MSQKKQKQLAAVPASTSSELPVYTSTLDGWVIRTEEELACVLELRDRLQDVASDCTDDSQDLSDITLIRFARARSLDTDKSEKLFRRALEWRLQEKPLEKMKTRSLHKILQKHATGGSPGTVAKDGTLVFINPIGQLDARGLYKHCPNVLEEYEFLILEEEEHNTQMLKKISTPDRPQYQMTVIFDLKGLSTKHFYRPAFKILNRCAQIGDDYYPERAKVVYIINTPRVFYAIWSVIKFCFKATTLDKIKIINGSGKSTLLKIIDADQLPVFLGGTLEIDGDPRCRSVIRSGGTVNAETVEALKT